jgi:hypothetical protein
MLLTAGVVVSMMTPRLTPAAPERSAAAVPPDILIEPPLRLALVIWRAAPLDVFCPARTL